VVFHAEKKSFDIWFGEYGNMQIKRLIKDAEKRDLIERLSEQGLRRPMGTVLVFLFLLLYH